MLLEWRKLWVGLRTKSEFNRLDEGSQLTWYRLIIVASDGEGICPNASDLAWEWRISEAEAQRRLECLVGLGWLAPMADGRYEIVKWAEYQGPDSDSIRAKRKRERAKAAQSDTKRDESDTTVTRERHDRDTRVTRLELEKSESQRREEKDTLEPSHAPGHTRGIPPPPAAWVPGFWLHGTQKLDLNGSWAMDQAVKRAMDRYGDSEGEATLRVRHILGIEREAEGLAALAQILEADGQKQMARILVLSEEVEKSRKGKRR